LHIAGDRNQPRELLLAALEKWPDNPALLRSLGEHYFILQQFNLAAEYLDRGERRDEFPDELICELAHEYAQLKPDDKNLTTDQMIRLLSRIKNFDGFEAMIVLNDQKIRLIPDERAAIIEEHLRSINPQWRDGWFEYDFEKSQLRVGGRGLYRLSYSGSILAGLQPRHLDISGSEIGELWKEAEFPIETLDVRGCLMYENNVEKLNPGFLRRLVHLKELIIQSGPHVPVIKELLAETVIVVERELVSEAAGSNK